MSNLIAEVNRPIISPPTKKVRFLIFHKGQTRKFFKLVFTEDLSFLIFPYGPNNEYYYGRKSMPENENKLTFDFAQQHDASKNPKVSIHQSGQVHVEAPEKERIKPMFIPELMSLKNEHIATVGTDNLSVLPKFNINKIKISGSEIDTILKVDDEFNNGRWAMFCSGDDKSLPLYRSKLINIDRNESKIFLYMKFFTEDSLHENFNLGGTFTIAGWRPGAKIEEKEDFIYVIAK